MSPALLAGCTALPSMPQGIDAVELTEVPFFPQSEYQCGPAALATVLVQSGLALEPDELVPEVYIEGLRGSLQAELLGATRRHARIPFVLDPQPAALFAELEAGRPVLVLQNLGFERVPVWHYAVVVGYEPSRDRMILRSGTEQRRLEPVGRFLRSWQRGENWAFVVLRPGELPTATDAATYAKALMSAEPWLGGAQARAAYGAALARWPDEPLLLFAAAAYSQGHDDLATAAGLYRRLLARQPQDAATRNNLANVLAEQGCREEALVQARAALAASGETGELHEAISDSVAMIEGLPAGDVGRRASPECAQPPAP